MIPEARFCSWRMKLRSSIYSSPDWPFSVSCKSPGGLPLCELSIRSSNPVRSFLDFLFIGQRKNYY